MTASYVHVLILSTAFELSFISASLPCHPPLRDKNHTAATATTSRICLHCPPLKPLCRYRRYPVSRTTLTAYLHHRHRCHHDRFPYQLPRFPPKQRKEKSGMSSGKSSAARITTLTNHPRILSTRGTSTTTAIDTTTPYAMVQTFARLKLQNPSTFQLHLLPIPAMILTLILTTFSLNPNMAKFPTTVV